MGALWPLVQFQQQGFMTLATATAAQVQDKTSSMARSQEGPGWRTDRSLPEVRAGRGSASPATPKTKARPGNFVFQTKRSS